MKPIFAFFLSAWILVAQEPSPQQVQREIQQADQEFNQALKLFNPWYTGPLITPGASMMPVGSANVQPYLFVTDTYASFNKERDSISLPNSLIQLQGSSTIQTGITDNFDFTLGVSGVSNWQANSHGGGFGDMNIVGGLLIYSQTRYVPQMKFTITQIFPTGKYNDLNTNGLNLNATGAGAYSTRFGFGTSKVLFWWTQHPLNLRAFVGYQLSTTVHVKNFNAYGGGFGTRGKVRPGHTLSVDFGAEYSLTQRWVLATDVVYTATDRSHFHGTPGTLANGAPATVGTDYSDNLSLSPAIEYNFSPNLGIIAGAWFSVYGRNSGNFASGVISVSYSFP